jgi:hypothetical protein
VETGEGGESKSKLSGDPPAVACKDANDRSSASPRGGVLLEALSELGSHPGLAQLFDWRGSSGRGTASRDTGKSPGRGTRSRETGKSPGRGTESRDTGKSSANRLAGGLTLKTVPQ